MLLALTAAVLASSLALAAPAGAEPYGYDVLVELPWEASQIATAPDGTVYVARTASSGIFRVGPGGALEMLDDGAGQIATGPDGSLYIAGNEYVVRHLPGGGSSIVAENNLASPVGALDRWGTVKLAIGPDGTIYLAEPSQQRVLAWVPGAPAGTEVVGQAGSTPAITSSDIVVDAAGGIYLSSAGLRGQVHRWEPGSLTGTLVSGAGSGGLVSPFYGLTGVRAVALGPDGSVLALNSIGDTEWVTRSLPGSAETLRTFGDAWVSSHFLRDIAPLPGGQLAVLDTTRVLVPDGTLTGPGQVSMGLAAPLGASPGTAVVVTGEIVSGGFVVEHGFFGVVSVNGTATTDDTTITVSLNRLFILPVLIGTISVSRGGVVVEEGTLLGLFHPGTPQGPFVVVDGFALTNQGFRIGGFGFAEGAPPA